MLVLVWLDGFSSLHLDFFHAFMEYYGTMKGNKIRTDSSMDKLH